MFRPAARTAGLAIPIAIRTLPLVVLTGALVAASATPRSARAEAPVPAPPRLEHPSEAGIEGPLDRGDLTPAELWEWLIHFTNYAGYPKAAPVWAEIRNALAKREILPLPASLGPGRDPELDREWAKPDADRRPSDGSTRTP